MKTKTCTKCEKEKEIKDFGKSSAHKDGLKPKCKECYNKYQREYEDKNKERVLKQAKKSRDKNKVKKAETDKKYQEENKEKISINKKKYYEDKKEFFLKKAKEYRDEKDPKQVAKYQKEYRDKPENKDRRNKQANDRYENDTIFHIKVALRNRVNRAIKKNYKSGSTLELLGCSIEELKKYLEKQFEPGMGWDNHGVLGWHIDHKTPCITFDLSDPKQQKECFNYTNLQPLWMEDNLRKARKTFNPGIK